MAKFEKMLANIAEYNSHNHRHIFYVSYIGYSVCDLTVKIIGTAGTMRYGGGYTWRECVRRYNSMAREEKNRQAAL